MTVSACCHSIAVLFCWCRRNWLNRENRTSDANNVRQQNPAIVVPSGGNMLAFTAKSAAIAAALLQLFLAGLVLAVQSLLTIV